MTRLVPVGLFLILLPGTLAAQRLAYEGSLGGSTGTYVFSERTTSYVLGTGLRSRIGRVTLRVSAPLWLQNTTLLSSSGVGPLPTGGPSGQGVVRDSGQAREWRRQGGGADGGGQDGGGTGGGGTGGNGQGGAPRLVASVDPAIPAPATAVTGYQAVLGDPLVSGQVELLRGLRGSVQLGSTVKVPLANTADVGTGAWDIGANLSLTFAPGRRTTIGLDVGYWQLGALDSLTLRNPMLASLSVGRLLGDRWGVMVGMSGSTAVVEGFDAPATVSLAITRFGDQGSWGLSIGTGLSESSPDVIAGLTWTVPWLR